MRRESAGIVRCWGTCICFVSLCFSFPRPSEIPASRYIFFLFVLVALEVGNQAGGRETKLNFCRDFKVPGSNLADAPFIVSLVVCFAFPRPSEIML